MPAFRRWCTVAREVVGGEPRGFAELGEIHRQVVAVGVQQAEVLLVVLHGGDQRFLRHRQEGRLETAQHRFRPLGQAHHLFQVVGGDAGHAAGCCGRVRSGAALSPC